MAAALLAALLRLDVAVLGYGPLLFLFLHLGAALAGVAIMARQRSLLGGFWLACFAAAPAPFFFYLYFSGW
ncbi:MAG: hypothetical protein AAB320_01960 [Elusimicrobiota bacterium]